MADVSVSVDLATFAARLESSESGLEFVYWCLDEFVGRLGLEDALLVTEHPVLGHQLFRAGRSGLASLTTSPLLAVPGLHVKPDVVSESEKRAIVALCRVALTAELAKHDASHDPLTGLFNRRSFDAEMVRVVARIERYGARFSVALLDVDGLKRVNDTRGHREGDRLLQTAGAELRRSLRAGDVAARLGGDEFGVILVSSPADAALHLRDRVTARVTKATGQPVGFSVGVATAPDESTDPDQLYRLADDRLYEDKRRSRNDPAA